MMMLLLLPIIMMMLIMDVHSQILLRPRKATVEDTDNDASFDEDIIDLNDILRDIIEEESFDKYQAAKT